MTTSAPVPHRPRRAALSPSRAKDFRQCPLLFRFRTVDRLPDPGSLATHRGRVVHAVLEHVFDMPSAQRTCDAALEMLPAQWRSHREANPDVLSFLPTQADVETFLEAARALIRTYFTLENPQRLEPAQREALVECETTSGLLLRGFVDRLDIAPNGAMRVVDYKTGSSPSPRFQHEALFQMRFYALLLWRARGLAPQRLQLVYLKNGRILTHDPHAGELTALESDVDSLWDEVEQCARDEHFSPRRSVLCQWCAYQNFCPAYEGTPPPIPAEGLSQLLTARRRPEPTATPLQ